MRHLADEQRLFIDGIKERHHAVTMPEAGGVDDEAGALRRRKRWFCLCFFEMTDDGFTTDVVAFGKFCGGLFASVMKCCYRA